MIETLLHLERYFGPMLHGWDSADGERWPFTVARLTRGPVDGSVAFSTLDLGGYPLESPVSGRLIRHEIVMLFHDVPEVKFVPGLLHQIGTESLAAGKPLLRGDVVGPRGPLFPGSKLEAFYMSSPCYLPDSFASLSTAEGDGIVFCWAFPITRNEAQLVRTQGWEVFEERLLEQDPDLMDIHRGSLVV